MRGGNAPLRWIKRRPGRSGRIRPTHGRPQGAAVIFVSVLVGVAVLMSGCSLRSLGDAKVLMTEADTRTVVVKPHPSMLPNEVLCAEPSPDVAKAVAQSFNLSTALEAIVRGPQLPAEGALQAAVGVSRAHAESLAQLTNRLATIQLLRDALYRACEAYANGALSKAAYAVILSRYDDLVVTLLTGELVAGNFGQGLTVLGTAAGGAAAGATRKAQDDAQAVKESQAKVDGALAEETKALAARNEAAKNLRVCAQQTAADCQSQKALLEQSENTLQVARDKVFTTLVSSLGSMSAVVQSYAQTVQAQGVGAVSRMQVGSGDDGANKTLHTIQRKFLENINADAMAVACITVLAGEPHAYDGRSPGAPSTFREICQTELPRIIHERQQLLRMKLMSGPEAVVASCAAAIHAGLDPKAAPQTPGAANLDAWRHKLQSDILSFCNHTGVSLLRAQQGLVEAQSALLGKQLEIERIKAESKASGGTK